PGLTDYRKKRDELSEANVHLLEVDLLRRGTRPFTHPKIPATTYQVTLTRTRARVASMWPIQLQNKLPILPIPLHAPDPDVSLDLGEAIRTIYDEAAYDLSINYYDPPPPPMLSVEQERWVAALLKRDA
ncbi:MAG: DUF4058 family protein, partial [Ardenticatenaceae bacterium]